MFGMGGGGGPIDYLRSRVSNWQAHPFQNLASTAFGAFVPGGGFAANALFDRYNNNQFNNSAQQTYDRGASQGNQAAQQGFDRPLGGPLGQAQGNPSGGPSGSPMGGGGMGPSSGYNGGYSNQTYNFGYGSPWATGNAPNQPSSFVNDILNSISTGPGQPGTQQGGLFDKGPEGRREGNVSGGGFQGPMGFNQFSPGTTLYQGMDPNQMVMANGRRNMY